MKKPDWYEELAADLGKEPNEDDLMEYSERQYGESLYPTMSKEEMIAIIDQFPDPRREC